GCAAPRSSCRTAASSASSCSSGLLRSVSHAAFPFAPSVAHPGGMLDGMRLAVLIAVFAAALAASARPAAAAAPCTRAAAKAAILADPLLRALRPIVTHGGGVDALICHDFTRDGATDM